MLDDRKLKILGIVVDEYIRTGEPVGSKVIAAMPGMKVSSATIRNDMSVLEQLGFLEQPHTSAGRVPTYAGYKLYIEKLMPQRELTQEEMDILDNAIDTDEVSEEALIESASRALAQITNCAAVSANISPKFSIITKVDAIPTGKRMYVLLMITSSGSIQNKICRLQFDLTEEQLEYFKNYMTDHLSGISVDSLSDDMIDRLAAAMGAYTVTLSPLLQGVAELAKSFMETDVRVSGERNLLARQDITADDIIRFMEQKSEIVRLANESFSDLTVLFGDNDDFVISNSSLLVSPIRKGDRTAGSLSLIGPMRLDYARVIPYLKYLTGRISRIITENTEEYRLIVTDNDTHPEKGEQ
ncbi:MAG: heat-inducible transcription repressor HrcA [Oscillospiraceae bacterium]|nr:heat-inducible transcription repressor HrcA [Oscillospiraceae bacterium]